MLGDAGENVGQSGLRVDVALKEFHSQNWLKVAVAGTCVARPVFLTIAEVKGVAVALPLGQLSSNYLANPNSRLISRRIAAPSFRWRIASTDQRSSPISMVSRRRSGACRPMSG